MMVRWLIATLLVVLLRETISAQNIGINVNGAAPDTSALLDVDAGALPPTKKKGFLLPRMTGAQRDAIASPAEALLIYSTDDHSFWYFDGTIWRQWVGGQDWRAYTTNGF